MPIILWVNTKDGERMARVNNIETFKKNVALMRCEQEILDVLKTAPKEAYLIFKIVGRYFCMIEVVEDEALRKMIFIDFGNDDSLALPFYAEIMKKEEKELAERFAQAIGYYKEIYEQGKNQVELRVDTSVAN